MHYGSCCRKPKQTELTLKNKVFFPLIVLTGLSGAGKSTALNVFEDLGFFAVDGLPASLVTKLVGLLVGQKEFEYKGLVLGMDSRQKDFVSQWHSVREKLQAFGANPQLIFIESKTDVLVRRYATTRRPHPLSSRDIGLEQAIERERKQLAPLRRDATLVLDTSHYSVHDLRRALQEKWEAVGGLGSGFRVHLISFGFKYGVPSEADMVYDLRFLPNPYFDPELRPFSGKDSAVSEYVYGDDPGKSFLEKLKEFLLYILPLYDQEGRYRLTIAFGCTGGRHRSVATAEAIYSILKAQNFNVSLEHRHLELG